MPDNSESAICREARFVTRARNLVGLMRSLNEEVIDLEEILSPYSVSHPEKSESEEDGSPNELVSNLEFAHNEMEEAINLTRENIQRIKENFRG